MQRILPCYRLYTASRSLAARFISTSAISCTEAKEEATSKELTKTSKYGTSASGEPLPGGILHEFFDKEENFGKNELRPKQRPGRSWNADELRLKSNTDLHKLWYVLLKEKNMLLTMLHAYKIRALDFPNPERLDRVEESMQNLEEVVHERNNAVLLLETGESGDPPERTVTSFVGFTYKKQATEHLSPDEGKEYETPYLTEEAYVTQKLWREKQHLKAYHAADDRRHRERWSDPNVSKYDRSGPRVLNRVEQLPQ